MLLDMVDQLRIKKGGERGGDTIMHDELHSLQALINSRVEFFTVTASGDSIISLKPQGSEIQFTEEVKKKQDFPPHQQPDFA